GKSTWAKRFKEQFGGDCHIVSADLFPGLYMEGRYQPQLRIQSHRWCKQNFLTWISQPQAGPAAIVVDNTNLHAWEISFYYQLAELFTEDVEIIEVHAPFDVCLARQL